MRIILTILLASTISSCSGSVGFQLGVPTEEKIDARIQALVGPAIKQQSEAINNQAKAIEALYGEKPEEVKE